MTDHASSAYLPGMQRHGGPAPNLTLVLPERLVLVAPPHRRPGTQRAYSALATYLSRATGKNIVYKRVLGWSSFEEQLHSGDYDVVLSSAHFASWLIANMKHEPLVRLAEQERFVVITGAQTPGISQLTDLAGRRLCAPSPPDAGTLSVSRSFHNPARQPLLVRSNDPDESYRLMSAGHCEAAVLPLRYYQTKPATDRALLTTAAMPGQTLTVGPRVPPAARAAITRALLSPEGQQIMQPLAARGTPQAIVPADKPDYAGLSELLHQIWGFDS